MKLYCFTLLLLCTSLVFSGENNLQNKTPDSNQPYSFLKKPIPSNPNAAIGNHMVFVDVFQLFFKQLTFGYEYIHDSDKVAIRIPATLGIGKKYMEIGAELKFFITKPYTFYRKIGPWDAGDANVRYFLGPAVCAINVQNEWLAAARFSNGISMQFLKGLNLSAYGSAGPAIYLTNTGGHQNNLFFYWAINGSIGYRFGK